MSEIATFRTALADGCSISIDCECGADTRYRSREGFEEAREDGDLTFTAGGDLEWALATDNFSVTCPSCGGRGETAVLRGGKTQTIALKTDAPASDGEYLVGQDATLSERRAEFTTVLNADPEFINVKLICSCGNTTTHTDRTAFEADNAALNPYALADNTATATCEQCGITADGEAVASQQPTGEYVIELRLSGREGGCPSCSAPIIDDGFGEGPEHPEIGWEYYECPTCGTAQRPEQVNPPTS